MPQPAHQQTPPGTEAEMRPKPDHGEESYKGCGKLVGKAAVITGGDSGIGRAVAIAFAREGADVLISYLDEHEDARETRRWVERAGRKCVLVPGDVSDPAHCRAIIQRAVGEFGKLDILVNNAAFQITRDSLEETPDEEWVKTFNLHAGDEAARRLEGQPNGKTEAWHILDAAPGATALVGLKPGVDRDTLRDALWREDFDAVMRRLPVRAGETVYVPGGTLHSFGPDTLIYEIEQTSDIQQHAMPWAMEDGSPVPADERGRNIEKLLEELRPEPRPCFRPPLRVATEDGVDRAFCCAGPCFALERWGAASGAAIRYRFDHATILSNVGAPVTLRAGTWAGRLGRAESRLLPAALGEITIEGPADVLLGYLPDLERDVRAPLAAAGHGPGLIASLGEGL